MTKPSVQELGDSARLELRGDCCIEGLTAHHEQLSRALEDGTALELDLSGITRIDTAGLQLVLAFVLEMKRQGREISTVAASEVVSQSVRSAGVGALLGL